MKYFVTVYCCPVCRPFSIATMDLQACRKSVSNNGTFVFQIANSASVKRLFLS